MTRRAGLLATVLLLAPLAFACGKEAEQPPKTAQPALPTPGVTASESPAVASPTVAATKAAAVASPPAAATTIPAQPAGTKAPVRPQPTEPQAPPPPAGATSAPPATPAEKAVATQPAPPAGAQQPPKGKITLPAKLGAVTFDHESHTGKRGIACTACHHSSRPQKPLASENQACRDCHAMPAAPPMKTNLQGAFHDPKAATGTCIDCHRQKGGSAPVKCLECHKRK